MRKRCLRCKSKWTKVLALIAAGEECEEEAGGGGEGGGGEDEEEREVGGSLKIKEMKNQSTEVRNQSYSTYPTQGGKTIPREPR